MTTKDKKFCKTFGARVRELRIAAEMTQVGLGKTLGATQQVIASYEVGRRRVPITLLPDLCKALNVTCDELFDGGNPKRSSEKK